jgi:long-chain-acyl-CoA dehydrogenase
VGVFSLLLQTVRHKLAELKTETVIARAFVDNCIALHSEHRLDSQMASMAERSPVRTTASPPHSSVHARGGNRWARFGPRAVWSRARHSFC